MRGDQRTILESPGEETRAVAASRPVDRPLQWNQVASREHDRVPTPILVAADVGVIVASLVAATWLRYNAVAQSLVAHAGISTLVGNPWTPVQSVMLLFQGLAIPLALASLGQYRIRAGGMPSWSVPRVMLATTLPILFALAAIYVTRFGYVPRGVIVLDFAFVTAGLVAWRRQWSHRVDARLRAGEGRRNVLFVGSGPVVQRMAEAMVVDHHYGRRVIGFLSDVPVEPFELVEEGTLAREDVWAPWHPKSRSHQEWIEKVGIDWDTRRDQPPVEVDGVAFGCRVTPVAVENMKSHTSHYMTTVGDTSHDSVIKALDGLCVEEVLIGPCVPREHVAGIVRTCKRRGVNVNIIPPHFPELAVEHDPSKMGDFTVVGLYKRPLTHIGWAAKRVVDIGASLAGLILASPLLLVAALAIKLEDPKAQVFYRSTRVGMKGKPFRMVKVTTMVSNAQEIEQELMKDNERDGPWFKLPADKDPRLLKCGRWIRKLSINEVPQLWNILKGEMSLVGPRPPLPNEVAAYVDYDFRYYRCLDVKPGITGLWQVTARNDPSFDRRIDLDLEYIHDWNILLDLKIIVRTVAVVLTDHED